MLPSLWFFVMEVLGKEYLCNFVNYPWVSLHGHFTRTPSPEAWQ